MDLSLSNEQKLLQDSVGKFIHNDYAFETRRALAQSERGFSDDNWQQFAELGWLMAPFSEDVGGLGGGAVETMLMMEAFGRGLLVEPYWASIIFAGNCLVAAGSAQCAELLGALMAGQLQLAVAFAEPQARYDLQDVITSADPRDQGYVINGRKCVVFNGPAAEKIILVARTAGKHRDRAGISLFVVDATASGISRQDYHTVDGMRASEMMFDGVVVDAGALLGTADNGLVLLEQAVAHALLGLGAEAAGIMDYTYKTTVEYTSTRKQFGQPLSSFQVLQHRMVDMFIETEQTKSLVLKAALELSQQDENTQRAVSGLKVQVGKGGRYVGQQAIQLHGGMGMTDEMAVGHYFKRLTTINQTLGDTEYHLHRYRSL